MISSSPIRILTLLVSLGIVLGVASCGEKGAPTEVRRDAILGGNTLGASADTFVPQPLPNQNHGSEKTLVVSNALIRFDQAALAAAIPAGGAMTSARLEVTVNAALTAPLTAGSTIGAFRMNHAWTELGATFNCAVDTNTSNAKPDCSSSDAWKMGGSSPMAWTRPATGTAPVATGQTGVLSFDVTSDVKGFLSGTLQNFGWLLRSDALTGAVVVAIGSRESANPPHLVVTIGCAAGFADCDHNPSNGCEKSLSTVTNCRACGSSCDDGNPCTADACDTASGCKHTPLANGTVCNDGNACTRTDSCQAGVCIGANPVSCVASDQCHAAGACNPTSGVCSNPALTDGTACNDGDRCTQTDFCRAGVCSGENLVICAAIDQCHVAGVCDSTSGTCSNPSSADGTVCNDGNACTRTDTCQSGACKGLNLVTCASSDQCHVAGVCDPANGRCSTPIAPNGTACTDGNSCTQVDTCLSGTCIGSNPITCTASDQCHVAGACDPSTGACSNPVNANGTTCNDGDACTQTDTCQAGVCVGSNPVICAASDQCHVVGVCAPTSGRCSNPMVSNGTMCDDGNSCTQVDACLNGTCMGSNPVTCTGTDQCHVAGTCDPSTGICSAPAVADGTTCSDTCGQAAACRAGACVATNPDAGGGCAVAKCQPGFADLDKDPTNGCEYACPVYPPTDEKCNAIDDDCDGQIDERFPTPGSTCYGASGQNPHPCIGLAEPMVRIGPVGSSWMFQFEASRPDATSTFAGAKDSRACSKQGALPWADVSQIEAAAACTKITDSAGAPMRLCAGPEWQTACEGPSATGAIEYSLSPNPGTYQAGICNDALIANPNASLLYNATIVPGNAWVTGMFTGASVASNRFCYADWTPGHISDLSGNVAEWTSTLVSTSAGISYFNVRGGSYNTVPFKCTIPFPECCANGPPTRDCVCDCHAIPGITCEDAGASQASTVASPDVGFRCCADHAP